MLVKNSIAAFPCSLFPEELDFKPPNGTCGSNPAVSPFIFITQASILSAKSMDKLRLLVNIAALSPY